MRTLEAPWIRLAQVSKVFQQGAQTIRAVDQVSLDVAPGEFLAITGASGSGKYAAAPDCRSGNADQWHREHRRRSPGAMDDAQLSTLRLRTIGFVFQFFNLLRR